MLPSAYVILDNFPMTTNGKIDKKYLAGLNYEFKLDATETPNEKKMAAVWSSVLKVDVDRIGRHTSFFELGGDSISAIQLVSRCKIMGWKLTNSVIFKYQTLQRITAQIEEIKNAVVFSEDPISGFVELAPIQSHFFRFHIGDKNFHNQSVLLAPKVQMTIDQVNSAMKKLISHHDLLRATFVQEEGTWKQKIASLEEYTFPEVQSAECESEEEVEMVIQGLNSSLSITNGPILRYALIQIKSRQLLFITCHHLIIDLVSWRIIIEDLETLSSGNLLPSKTLPFPTWTKELQEWSKERTEDWSQHTQCVTNVIQSR
jgi:acyl carrier protein